MLLEFLELVETVVLPVVTFLFGLTDTSVDLGQHTAEFDVLHHFLHLVCVLVVLDDVCSVHFGGNDCELFYPAVDEAENTFIICAGLGVELQTESELFVDNGDVNLEQRFDERVLSAFRLECFKHS